jgi:hypothetical protein
MSSFTRNPLQPAWDRQLDGAGRPIRADVCAAGRAIWDKARRRAGNVLGDTSNVAELMDK